MTKDQDAVDHQVEEREELSQALARVRLHRGYGLSAGGPRGDALYLEAPTGGVCLTIRLLPTGPVVEVAAGALRVVTEGDISLECERFQVDARQDIAMVAGGSIAHDAGAHVTTRAGGEIMSEGDGQQHRARLGNVDVVANDDISLRGERVRLNCPTVLTEPRPSLPSAIPSRGSQS